MNKGNIVTGLDLGTTKVCAIIAQYTNDNEIRILGSGVAKSEGLHKGLVANILKTSEAIKEAISKASLQAGVEVTEVNVGVAGEHISSIRHRNYVTISNDDHEIGPSDLKRLEEDVRRMRIPNDMQILHVIPEEFIVDSSLSVVDPIGMSAAKLEATNHVVLASIPAIANIRKSIERAGYKVKDYILQPLASAASILEASDKEVGVLMIDIGGGTTDIAVIHRGAIIHSKVFGIAGNQVTHDIRETLGIVTDEAEHLKKNYGYATQKAIIKDEEIIIKGVGAWGSQPVHVSLLTQIISARMSELFNLVDNEIRSAKLKNKIRMGVILTGGGALLRGSQELAQEIFGLPVRIGVPLESLTGSMVELEKPEFATVMGLLKGAPGQKINFIPEEKEEEEDTTTQKSKKKGKETKSDKEKVKFTDNKKIKKVMNNIREFFKDL